MKPQLFTLLLVLLTGCITGSKRKAASVDLLDFLVDGHTSRAEVLLKLGQPTNKFEAEKILTYQIGIVPGNAGYYVAERRTDPSGWPNWRLANYSLVLVFDENGVLRRHSKVKVN